MTLLLIPAGIAWAWPVVPIDSIQWVPIGGDSSRYAGDSVVTGGMVTAGSGAFYAGAGVTFYMEDPAGGPWSGVMAYAADPSAYPTVLPGDSIKFTCLVNEYQSPDPFANESMTELLINPTTFQFPAYGLPEPEPVVVLAGEIDSTSGRDSNAEQFEAVFIRVNHITVDSLINYTGTSEWICHDSLGDSVCVREASDSIPNSFRPPAGTQFDYVQGVVYHRFGVYSLQPRYMRDMRFANGAPLATISHSPEYPLVGEMVTFTATAVDDQPIPQDSVKLIYRWNLGGWTEVPMTRVGTTDNYTFQLPSPVAGWKLDYYVHVRDNEGHATNEPSEAPFGFHYYVIQQAREMTIAQARVDANADWIPDLLDSAVIVTGIATSSNFSTSQTDFYMQQAGAGIEVYYPTLQIVVNPGDSVRVNGIVKQVNGKTRIQTYADDRITILGTGTLPAPTIINCHEVRYNGEVYEGTLVKVLNSKILPSPPSPDPWPTIGLSATLYLSDLPADTADLFISSTTDIDGQPQVQEKADIVGIMSQYDTYPPYNGWWELMPRTYFDFVWIEPQTGCAYVPGDVNGRGGFTGLDVVYAVAFLKGGAPPTIDCNPPCSQRTNPPGPLPDPFYAQGDVNASCSFTGLDVTYMVGYLKGGPVPRPCPDCMPQVRTAPSNDTPTVMPKAPQLIAPQGKSTSSSAQ
jgi:hypothetical protein